MTGAAREEPGRRPPSAKAKRQKRKGSGGTTAQQVLDQDEIGAPDDGHDDEHGVRAPAQGQGFFLGVGPHGVVSVCPLASRAALRLASGALQNPFAPRVRFAPSPTGSLHVGGARTALYNLLFARHEKGTFLLRIEDTDVERSREELTAQILSAMEWLGLEYDEGPFHQSQRYELYRAAADRLLREGKAYRAFETPEELDAERKKAEASGSAYRYSGAGRDISPEESDRRARAGERHVVRLKMPAETIVVDDLIRGRVEFPAEALDDFVLVRSDGHPLYHFCVCVDDTDMRITHVIRGDDHLANTPKHVALFQALGAPIPKFAHLGMILGTDRKKLSKRHGAAAVEEWRDEGILPEALFNFLALLGWAPGGDREILTREEMESEFALEKVGPRRRCSIRRSCSG